MKTRSILLSMVFVLMLLSVQSAWSVTTRIAVDAQHKFYAESDRAFAIDSSGKIHTVYGEDSLYYASLNGANWNIQIIDPSHDQGKYAGIVVDSSDKIYIVYHDTGLKELKLAQSSDGGITWTLSSILDNVYLTARLSFVIDASNALHVYYYDIVADRLNHLESSDGVIWNNYQIVSTPNSLGYFSAQVTSAGQHHLSYYDFTNKDLYYASSADGQTWTTTALDTTNDTGQYSSLDIDASGNIYIGYYYTTSRDLKLAKYSAVSSTWSIQTLDSAGSTGSNTSLKISSSGIIYLCYQKTNLYCKTSSDGTIWTAGTKAIDGNPQYASLVAGSAGSMHVRTFDNGSTYNLIHSVTSDGVTWTSTTIDTYADVGRYSKLKIDQSGKIHAIYYDSIHTDLKYAYSTDQYNWFVKTLSVTGFDLGEEFNFVIDTAGVIHFVFTEEQTQKLYYTSSADALVWSTPVEVSDNYSYYINMALDENGVFNLSFIDINNYLVHATSSDGQNWILTPIENSTNVSYDAMVVDAAGKIHVAYLDDTNKILKYTSSSDGGATWNTTDIDSTNSIGSFLSLGINSAGVLYVASHDSDSTDVHLVLSSSVDNGVTWTSTLVDDTSMATGQYTSLFIDAEDRLHLSYFDNAAGDVRYATSSDGVNFDLETVSDPADEAGLHSTFITGNNSDELFIGYQNLTTYDFEIARISDCGNGTVDSGEACDDGNSIQGDSCSNTCESMITWYRDQDGDGQGLVTDSQQSYSPISGYVVSSTDCDDTNAQVFQGGTDICGDGVDQDCSGSDTVCPVVAVTPTAGGSTDTETESTDTSIQTQDPVTTSDTNSASGNSAQGNTSGGCSLNSTHQANSGLALIAGFGFLMLLFTVRIVRAKFKKQPVRIRYR